MLDHFDLIASIYDRLIGPPDTERLQQLLNLPTDGWLLDGGGGTGRVSSRLNGLVGHIVVSDLSHRDGFFDRVLVVDALHHFCDQGEAIEDLLRVLKPGGRLVIEEPDYNHEGIKLLAFAEKMLLMRSHFYTPKKIQKIIVSCGFSAKIEYDDRYTAWVVVEK